MNEKAMEEFKFWWLHDDQRELRQSCAEGWGLYIWTSSRAGVEVELPSQRNVPDRDCWARTNALGYNTANHECRTVIESLGLKVKP